MALIQFPIIATMLFVYGHDPSAVVTAGSMLVIITMSFMGIMLINVR